MNCREIEQMIHGYLDDELDLTQSLNIEAHLEDCPTCARAYREWRALRTAMAHPSLHYDAPRGLKRRVATSLDLEREERKGAPRQDGLWPWRWSAVVAPIATAAVALMIALPLVSHHAMEDQLANEVLSAHVRSLMVDHKTDVASSDQHTVKPWFDGKLDFAPPVQDFADRGFNLVGGRLDYLRGRPVAALVYQRRKHFINLFIWPADGKLYAAEQTRTLRGYNLSSWISSGMSFWAASDLNPAELQELVRLVSGR